MNEQTTQLIEKLASKLGTTTEYLWAVLIRQAPIDSAVILIQFSIIVFLWVVMIKKHKALSAVKDYGNYSEESGYSYYEETAVIPMVVAFAVLTIVSVVCFFHIPSVFYGFFNKEYWALKEILRSIG